LIGDELIAIDEDVSLSQVPHDKQDDDDDSGNDFSVVDIRRDIMLLLLIQCRMTWIIITASPILTTAVPPGTALQYITKSNALFGLSAWLFRLTCADCRKRFKNHFVFHFLLKLPELLTSIVIFFIFIMGKMGAALVALHCGFLLLTVLALGGTVHFLFFTKPFQHEQEDEEEIESRDVGMLTV
jgi:hypothetical protein